LNASATFGFMANIMLSLLIKSFWLHYGDTVLSLLRCAYENAL